METRIDVDRGKYTVVIPDDGGTHILRYGQPWIGPHFEGSNCVLRLAHEVADLRAEVAELRSRAGTSDPLPAGSKGDRGPAGPTGPSGLPTKREARRGL